MVEILLSGLLTAKPGILPSPQGPVILIDALDIVTSPSRYLWRIWILGLVALNLGWGLPATSLSDRRPHWWVQNGTILTTLSEGSDCMCAKSVLCGSKRSNLTWFVDEAKRGVSLDGWITFIRKRAHIYIVLPEAVDLRLTLAMDGHLVTFHTCILRSKVGYLMDLTAVSRHERMSGEWGIEIQGEVCLCSFTVLGWNTGLNKNNSNPRAWRSSTSSFHKVKGLSELNELSYDQHAWVSWTATQSPPKVATTSDLAAVKQFTDRIQLSIQLASLWEYWAHFTSAR